MSNGWLKESAATGMRKLVHGEKSQRHPRQVPPWSAFLDVMAHIKLNGDLGSNPTLLDAGCGVGAYAWLVDDYYPGFQYRGCDISPSMIEYARRDYGDRFFVADMLDLEQGADVILVSSVIEACPLWRAAVRHLLTLDFQYLLLHRVRIWNDCSRESDESYHQMPLYGISTFIVFHNRDELLDLIENAGGKVTRMLVYQMEPQFSLCSLLIRRAET